VFFFFFFFKLKCIYKCNLYNAATLLAATRQKTVDIQHFTQKFPYITTLLIT
jgi:hypothetical protein